MLLENPEMSGKAFLRRPYWLDEVGDLAGKVRKGGPLRIVDNETESFTAFSKLCDVEANWIYFNIQLNHDRLLGSALHAHLHWFQEAAAVPNWVIYYRWQVNGAVKVTDWTPLGLKTHAFTWVSGTILQISKSVAIAAPATDGLSSIFQVRLTRDKDNSSGQFTGNDLLDGDGNALSFDLHKRVDSFGSMLEYTKFV